MHTAQAELHRSTPPGSQLPQTLQTLPHWSSRSSSVTSVNLDGV